MARWRSVHHGIEYLLLPDQIFPAAKCRWWEKKKLNNHSQSNLAIIIDLTSINKRDIIDALRVVQLFNKAPLISFAQVVLKSVANVTNSMVLCLLRSTTTRFMATQNIYVPYTNQCAIRCIQDPCQD
jgi:hypothetical protein